MLINLCESYLETKVKCDQPSTDGYDVDNLITNTDLGFLAYSTIKPPINVDFHFVCNFKLSHILIWPRVGSQKSTGFKISTKFHRQPYYNLLSSGFLNSNHIGISFTTKYANEDAIIIPSNFCNVKINKHDNIIDCFDNLRISIVKTDKSVPAINKIEIWAYISLFNKRENSNKICNLLIKYKNPVHRKNESVKNSNNEKMIVDQSIKSCGSLVIPEEYLDPITWTIMLQPIILPSGKIIDQKTLENYGDNEALWGRPLNDPFTGIMLTNNYKPIFALQLKLKIDKFLSENSDNTEIKNLPRILGYKNTTNLSSLHLRDSHETMNIQNKKKLMEMQSDTSMNKSISSENNPRHKLPIVSPRYSRNLVSHNISKTTKNSSTAKTDLLQSKNDEIMKVTGEIDDKLEKNLQKVLENLKCFSDMKKNENLIVKKKICNCCEFPICYKLPCNHIVCRKIILSRSNKNNKNLQCPQCNFNYKLSETIKFHN